MNVITRAIVAIGALRNQARPTTIDLDGLINDLLEAEHRAARPPILFQVPTTDVRELIDHLLLEKP
jgi:hypothetical protein